MAFLQIGGVEALGEPAADWREHNPDLTERPRLGVVAGSLPAVALLGTFARTDYIYMTGGAGYRGLWPQAAAYIEAHRRPGEMVAGDWAARRMIQYYLEEPDTVLLPHRFSEDDMRALLTRPAWILLQAYHPSAGDRTEQLRAAGTLQAYFADRLARPRMPSTSTTIRRQGQE